MEHTDRPTSRYAPPAIATRQTVAGLLEVTSSDPGAGLSAHFEQ